MFLILVHSDFLGIPLPMPSIIHKYKSEKKDTLLNILPLKKTEECDGQKVKHGKDKNVKLQKPEFVLLLQTVQSPARRMQAENIGQKDTPMRK